MNPSRKIEILKQEKNEPFPRPLFFVLTYSSIPTNIHSSLVTSSSEDDDEEFEHMLEKLPLRPELLEEKLSLLIDETSLFIEGGGNQWARVMSSKPTQPKSRIRLSVGKQVRVLDQKKGKVWGSIRSPSVFLSKQMTRRSQLKHSVASSIRAIKLWLPCQQKNQQNKTKIVSTYPCFNCVPSTFSKNKNSVFSTLPLPTFSATNPLKLAPPM